MGIRPGVVLFIFQLTRIHFIRAIRRPSFWWISLGFPLLSLTITHRSTVELPLLLAGTLCWSFPFGFFYRWRKEQGNSNLFRIQKYSPLGKLSSSVSEVICAVFPGSASAFLFLFLWSIIAFKLLIPWQILFIIPSSSLAAGAITILVSKYQPSGSILVSVFVISASVLGNISPIFLRLLCFPGYLSEIGIWYSETGGKTHPDLYLAVSVLFSIVFSLLVWGRKNKW